MSISSTSAAIENELEKLRVSLTEVGYGEVGLVFVLHEGRVVRVRRIVTTNCRLTDPARPAESAAYSEVIRRDEEFRYID